MKKRLIYLLYTFLILFPSAINGQNYDTIMEYHYDQEGNCTGRNVIVYRSTTESENTEELTEDKSSVYSDKLTNTKIYPNPTKGLLSIEIRDFNENLPVNITFYDISGKLLMKQTMSEPYLQLDISTFVEGTYILKIQRDKKISPWKIIKIN